ncbi:inner centromere protein A [Lycodopsis pacificus]
MNTVRSSVQSLKQQLDGKLKEFTSEIETVHMVWLVEIQQEANRMFSGDFVAEPELMPKTPSQKRRRKRVSTGNQEEHQARRRYSKGRRSNLRGPSVKSLNFIAEEETVPEASTSDADSTARPKRTTRKNKQTVSEAAEDASQSCGSLKTVEEQNKKPEEEEMAKSNKVDELDLAPSLPGIPSPGIVVRISSSDQLAAECAKNPLPSPGRTAAKIAIAGAARSSRRSSVRCSLKLRHSLAGLRHSMTQDSVRRASRRSMLKRKVARMGNSTCSSNVDDDSCVDSAEEEDRAVLLPVDDVSADSEDNAAAEEWMETPELQINQSFRPSVGRITRSVAANSATLAPPSTVNTLNKSTVIEKQLTSGRMSRQSTKRKAPDTVAESPTKRPSPPKKSQSAMRPNMKSFLHTVQRNQMLMMTPTSLGRAAVMKSFIRQVTPLRIDPKAKERYKLEALKKKQELEEERMKKMDEEKKRKQDDLKRKRDERLRRVFEAKVKEEQREVEKKKKIEQKMAQIDEKNDKRLADDKAKKKEAIKRQDDLEQKRKLEEDSKRKKIQQAEEEKRQQELLAKKAEEEEQRARKLAEARRALELERERLAAAERERVEKEKALALQQEVERAAREKERREQEEKRKARLKRLEEERRLAAEEKAAKEREAAAQKAASAKEERRLAAEEKAAEEREAAAQKAASAKAASCLNVTVDIERSVMGPPVGKGADLNKTVDVERSPQSYPITPKADNKPLPKFGDDYGMDQNSDDSTDDESAPRKPVPSWAEARNLQHNMMKQYFNPPDLDALFGTIAPPKLENIFYKSKPRYFKRTSSAVWHSPPFGGK